MTDEPTATPLRTTDISLAIIEALREHDGGGISEVAEYVDVSPSTAYRHLFTLKESGYVVFEDGRYQLSLRFLRLGTFVQRRNAVYELAQSYTKRLAQETNSRSVFLVAENNDGVYVHTSATEDIKWTGSTIGKRVPLYATAAGKAILAFDDSISIADLTLTAHTPLTITSIAELESDLTSTRERGYALNMEEQITGVNAVGVPVFGGEDDVVGAFSVAGPANQMQGDWFDNELPQILLGIANEFELQQNLGDDI